MSVMEQDLLHAIRNFNEKKAFLFDMDGLIFDTERCFMEQLSVVMKEHGYTLGREIYCETLGLGGQRLIDTMKYHYGEEYPFTAISRETVKRVGIVAETVGLAVKPQIPEALRYLQERKVPCAVVSSTRSSQVEKFLNTSGLRHYFQQIIGGEMVDNSKPEPDIFLLACRRLGKEPKECVVLEDSENGLKAGIRAGCEVILIPDLKEPDEEIAEQAAYVIRH